MKFLSNNKIQVGAKIKHLKTNLPNKYVHIIEGDVCILQHDTTSACIEMYDMQLNFFGMYPLTGRDFKTMFKDFWCMSAQEKAFIIMQFLDVNKERTT